MAVLPLSQFHSLTRREERRNWKRWSLWWRTTTHKKTHHWVWGAARASSRLARVKSNANGRHFSLSFFSTPSSSQCSASLTKFRAHWHFCYGLLFSSLFSHLPPPRLCYSADLKLRSRLNFGQDFCTVRKWKMNPLAVCFSYSAPDVCFAAKRFPNFVVSAFYYNWCCSSFLVW